MTSRLQLELPIQLICIVFITTQAVRATPVITVHKGASATIPCNVKITHDGDVISATWYNGTENGAIIVFNVDGEKDGPGYKKGEFSIADDYSLIINKVTSNDGGNYTCGILQSSGWMKNTIFVDVYIEPPTPRINKCPFDYIGGNCTYTLADQDHDELNITCFVLGDFSNINLYFRSQNEVISGISGQSQVDGVNILYITISAVPTSEPYECVARSQKSTKAERSTSIQLRRQRVEANSNDTREEVKSDAVECSPQAVIWLSIFFCLLLLVNIILLARKKKRRIISQLRKYVTQIDGTLVQNRSDEEAHHLMDCQHPFKGEYAKKDYLSITSLKKESPNCQNCESDRRMEVMGTNSEIEFVQCYNYTSASEMSAAALCSMPSLRMLRFINANLDDSFYKTMANEAHKLKKIETLIIIDNRVLPLNVKSSRSLARGIQSLPNLHNLHLVCGSLQELFFKIFSEADNEKMRKLWFSMHGGKEVGNRTKMESFMKALTHMKALQTLGISVGSVTESHLAACLKKLSGLENLRMTGEPIRDIKDESCSLLNEIVQLPSLQALYLLRPGKRLLDLPECTFTNAQLKTLILREVTLSEVTMQAVLSIGALRSVHFMNVTSTSGDATCHQLQKSCSRTYDVKEIRTDVESLSVLLRLHLFSCCPKVSTLQIDFKRDISKEDIDERLANLKSVTTLILRAFRKPSFFSCSSVSLKDETLLRHAMKSLRNVNRLYIIDINIGAKEAAEIIKALPSNDHLQKLVMTRCNTTSDGICQEQTRDSQELIVTHGKPPDTVENGKGERYQAYLQNTDRTHFDGHFEVICRD